MSVLEQVGLDAERRALAQRIDAIELRLTEIRIRNRHWRHHPDRPDLLRERDEVLARIQEIKRLKGEHYHASLGIQIEGAVDYACGRPRDANPYSAGYTREQWFAGWDDAAGLFPPEKLARERARWR